MLRLQHSRPRGGALAATFLAIMFLVIFGLTLVNLATFDLRTVNRAQQRALALSAAEAGLEQITGELARDPKVGLSNEAYTQTLPDKSRYKVTFEASGAPYRSVNNLGGQAGVPGYNGRTVPPYHASVISQGWSPSGEVAVVEGLLRLEAIPYAIAGTGRLNLNTITATAARSLAQAGSPDLDGSVYSGAPGPNSLDLGGLSRVTGDARSVGGITVGGASNVLGDIEENQSPESLPDLVVTDFINDGKPGISILPGGINVTPILTGQVYYDDSVTFTGAVTMVNAEVYVKGDLTVNGVIAGTGTVFVEGETSFLSAVNLAGNDRLTLFSGGDINILLPSVFQGVLYTHGNVNGGPLFAVTVFGAVYAVNTTQPALGNVNLGLGSRVIHLSDFTAFASSYLAANGQGNAVRVYWAQLR